MATWNNQYKLNPPDDNNPGYGAAAIRDLKTNIEGIVGVGHNFDLVTPSNQGKHLPGTAIVDLDSDAEAVNHLQKGRLKATTVGTEATLIVKGATADQPIKGYDQVSLSGDETITGTKTFTTSPSVTQTVSDASPDTTLANVGYVKTKTTTDSIEPTLKNVSPAVNQDITDIYANTIVTIPHQADTTNLESLLNQINTELIAVRSALDTTASHNSFGQNLRVTDTVSFGGLNVNGALVATGDITGANVYGAVWG
jgi:hypothetical protein